MRCRAHLLTCKGDCGPVSFCLETPDWAVIDRPYSSGINTVGAVYDRATSYRRLDVAASRFTGLP